MSSMSDCAESLPSISIAGLERGPGGSIGTSRHLLPVSTDDQSCERQEHELRAFATRRGHRIVAFFRERAAGPKSARANPTTARALAQFPIGHRRPYRRQRWRPTAPEGGDETRACLGQDGHIVEPRPPTETPPMDSAERGAL